MNGFQAEYPGNKWASQIHWGSVTDSTDGSGDIVFAHGGTTAPDAVFVEVNNLTYDGVVTTHSATTITMRVLNRATAAAAPGATSTSFRWLALWI